MNAGEKIQPSRSKLLHQRFKLAYLSFQFRHAIHQLIHRLLCAVFCLQQITKRRSKLLAERIFFTLVFSICSAQRSISCACRRSCSGETVIVLLFKINAPFYCPTCGYCCICADCPASWVWKEPGHSPGPQAENVRYENAGKWSRACHYAVS